MKEYKLKGKRGIDDLQGIYAFIGNSQGDTTATNDIDVYKSSQGWLSFVFDCLLTQTEIDGESLKRKRENEEYIRNLKKEGKYGEEYETSISLQENPVFDAPQKNRSLNSYSFHILDLSK